MDRWVFTTDMSAAKALRIPSFISWVVKRFVKKQAYAQGVGRHSEEETIHIARLDIEAVSNYLGMWKQHHPT